MKKSIIYLFLITSIHAFAQKDAEAKAILNQVSLKYHAYNIVKSDFTFTIHDPQGGVDQTQNGTIIVQAKTNKYNLTLYSPDATAEPQVEQQLISDGKSQWTYIKKDKEVQLSNVDHSDEGFNPAQLFTVYEKGYKYIYTGQQLIKGKTYQAVDLTPEDINKSFFKIRLMIDKAKKQIYSAQIFENNGSRYNYTVHTMAPDPQAPASTFIYDSKAHPGVELVDLRQ